MEAATERLPKYRRSDEGPPIRITERDVAIIDAVYKYRFLTSTQIMRLLFGSSTRANFRLQKLFHNGYLDRVFLPTVTGSSPAIYCVDKKGAALLEDIKEKAIKFDKRRNILSHRALEHFIAVNEVRIALELAVSEHIKLREFLDERAARRQFKAFNPETKRDAKRTFSPDAFFRITIGEGILSCFVELDRGNQDQKRKIRRKIENYQAFLESGAYNRNFGGSKFRTLFIIEPKWGVTSLENKRLQNIKTLAEEVGADYVWLTTLPELTKNGFFEASWYRAGMKKPQKFLEEPPS